MAEDLKKETVKGVFWSGIDKISNGGIIFVANIILARLLMPEDFGLLAIITILIQISQTFIDCGFTNALIQKKDRSQEDYSTVFLFNLALSIGFYFILFLTSPLVSLFFNEPRLATLIRVVGLNLIIGAVASVHKTRLTIELCFKIQSIISLISAIISAIVSIWLAFHGFGVWALVILTLLNTSIQTIQIYLFIRWRPSLLFSRNSFQLLFSYSSKLLGASLIHLLYRNIYPIIIGKKFNSIDLGYFNRADTLASYGPLTFGTIVSRVAFPIFSRIQDNEATLGKAYSKYIIFTSLLIFPIMIGLIILARPLTIVILKEQWLPMVPMFQILCIDWMFEHLNMINLNVLYVKGRSDIAFRNEILKKSLAIIIFLISIKWGIIGICWGRVIYGCIAIYINSYYTKRLIGLSLLEQLHDVAKPLFYAFIMGTLVFCTTLLGIGNSLLLIIAIGVGLISYMLILLVGSPAYFSELLSLIKK